MINRRQFLSAAAAAATAAALPAQKSPGPNIICIMADDLGYGDLGCFGQKTLKTPHIDSLAAEGMKCTDVYAASTVCAPSRCGLITGKHMGHATVRGNRNPEVPLKSGDDTIGKTLQSAGYTTALFGKWGVGGPVTLGRPNLQGFDHFFGYLSQWHAHEHFPTHLWDNETERFIPANFGRNKGAFSHDLFTDRALDFLDQNHDSPFFLYLPYAVPHTNNELGRYTGDGMEVPDYLGYENEDWPEPEKGFAAQVKYLDRDVGRIIQKLKDLKVDDNTIVFFTSDNGAHQEGGHKVDFFESNGPLRAWKRDLYEGGIRVPMIVRWPGKIEAGAVSDHPWTFYDVLATFADLAGVEAPDDTDGVSVLPTLLGQDRRQQQHEYLYWEFHERRFAQAVRFGNLKAVKNDHGQAIEIYDLSKDLSEQKNVAAENPDAVRRAEKYFAEARFPSPYWPTPDEAAPQAAE